MSRRADATPTSRAERGRSAPPAPVERYVSACLATGSDLRNAVRAARLPGTSLPEAGRRPLDRPWFVCRTEIEEFAADATALLELVISLPDRLFDGDLDRYCGALGIPERRAALLRRGARGRPTLLGRADAYHDGDAYRLLEFNLGSELGGMDLGAANRALLELPEFRAFAEENQLDYVDTASRLAAMLRDAGRPVTSGADPTVALIEDRGDLARYANWHVPLQRSLRRYGLDLLLGEIGEIRVRAGKVTLHGKPIDVILRNFSVNAILADPQGPELAEPVLRAHEDGKTVLFTTFESGLYSNKGALALLSESRARGLLSTSEETLADRLLPWTRSLAGGADADLLDHCRRHRTELVLKPRVGYGGRNVVAGWETPEAAWAEALRTATEQGHVVQRRVRPRPEPVVDADTGAVERWAAVLGVFVTEYGYGGAFGRALPVAESAVIAWSANHRTRVTGVFSHPSEPAGGPASTRVG
ncbi:hypothetical protein AB0J86_06250 [Micromonospora sp. NPDC049559]|uniref:hypothetical protein n=1 Tax=Micromonospora sp. NPDC049559 TaxID=3155923 RepID=UPI00341723FF